VDRNEVLEKMKAAEIDTLRVDFADMHGIARGKIIPAKRLDEILEEGINCAKPTFSLDLSYNIPPGTGTAEEVNYEDMTIIPDLNTFTILPYQKRTARFIGDIFAGGKPFLFSPRELLKRVMKEYEALGMLPVAATELEFFVFKDNGESLEYYSNQPSNVYTTNLRVDPIYLMRKLQNALLSMGIDVLYTNHEFFQGQYEINWRHTDAMTMADQSFTFKTVCKEMAFINNLLVTFMDRPKNDMGGSGYHLHVSMNDVKTGKTLFDDPKGKLGMSDTMRHFIGGQLAHAKGMTPFFAPIINSYKRYALNSFAPYYIAWGLDNRTTYIRVPNERGKATRIENRAPCASANPYLVIAVALIAGLDGIKKKIDPGDYYEGDIYTEEPGKFETMPGYLHEAIGELMRDEVLCDAIGPEIIKNFTTLKLAEAERFRTFVTDWETQEYAYHL